MMTLLLAAVLVGSYQDEADLAAELPRLEPLEAAEARASFRLQPGFRLQAAAVEPAVADPVDAAYDEDGRLYVVEMRGYPYPENTPPGRVRRLEDLDGDGVFERSTVFLDDLSWPTSIICSNGGVFIAAPPDLIFASDGTGDGVADERKVVLTGFGKENVQALYNGLIWGTDGWIHANGSSNGGTIRNLVHPELAPIELGRRDFRFRPDLSAVEPISGGGQFGHTLDDWGRRFTCSNSNHIRQVVLEARYVARNPDHEAPATVVDIPAEGAAAKVFRISPPEPWRVVRTRQRASDPEFRRRLPSTELVATGFFTSATGVTIYRGTAYPEEYRGNAFIGDVGGNLVHRKRMEADGAIEKAVRADEGVEFLASTDNWFRPVNFENTPWGTLLILDMYRETIEHPWSIPEPIKKHLDLTSGHDRGRLYELLPDGFQRRKAQALGGASTAELAALLADRDAWWRETAQRLILERRPADAPGLLRRLVAERPTALGRMHGLWTLAALGASRPEEILLGLGDPEPRVRECTAVLAEELTGNEGVRAALLRLASDGDPRVRFQAALSIGAIEGSEATEALASIARVDRGDPWTRAAVMSSCGGRAAELLTVLLRDREFVKGGAGRAWVEDLAAMAGASADPAKVAALLGPVAEEAGRGSEARSLAVALLSGARRRGGGGASWLSDGAPTAPIVKDLLERARADLASDSTDLNERVVAVELIGLVGLPEDVELLGGLLEVRQATPVQLAALRALGASGDARVGTVVLDRWKSLAPTLRREAGEVMFARADRLVDLLKAIESGRLSASDLDPARLAALPKHADEAVRSLAERVSSRSASRDKGAVLKAYQPALALEGRAEEGRGVFRRVCATCHQVEGFGTQVGPDLATVSNRTEEDLLLHILDPNREVLPQYMSYIIATADGRTLTGLVAAESPTSITLKRAEGVTDVVPRDQIEEMASAGISQMPEGLEKDVDPQAMADVIAYLRGLSRAGGP